MLPWRPRETTHVMNPVHHVCYCRDEGLGVWTQRLGRAGYGRHCCRLSRSSLLATCRCAFAFGAMSSWVRVATRRRAWRRRRWLRVCRRRHRCRCGEVILPPLTYTACFGDLTLGRLGLGRLRCPCGCQGWGRRDGSHRRPCCRGAIDAWRPQLGNRCFVRSGISTHRCLWRDR